MSEIRFRFTSTGADEVASALKGVASASRDATRAVNDQGKASAVAGREAVRAARSGEQASERRWKEIQRSAAKIEKELEREAKAAERVAAAKIKAEERVAQARTRLAEKAARQSERMAARQREQSMSFMSGLGGSIAGGIGGAALAFGGSAALAGAATVGAAARSSLRLNEQARRIAINARGSGERMMDPLALQKEFEGTALAHQGVRSEDVATGTAAYIAKTGDLGTARRMQSTFATASLASGASYESIAGSAADIASKFNVKGEAEMQEAFSALLSQGKSGAFELADLSNHISRMSAAAARFGVGEGVQAIKTLGGLAQVARQATGSGEQAATAIENMFSQLTAKQKQLDAVGVKVFDDQGQTRSIGDILAETIGKVGGSDIGAKKAGLTSIFGAEGIRAVSPLISRYVEASQGAKGSDAARTAAGMAAVKDMLRESVQVQGNWSDVVDDAAQAQRDASSSLTAAWAEIQNAVTLAATPAIVELAPKLVDLAGATEPVIAVFSALLEGVTAVVDKLKDEGILKPRQRSAEEINAEIGRLDSSVAARQKSYGGWSPSDENAGKDLRDTVRRNALVAERDAALSRRAVTDTPMAMDKATFAKEYANRAGFFARFAGEGLNQKRGEQIFDEILANPAQARAAHSKTGLSGTGETEEQKRLTANLATAFEQGRNNGGVDTSADTSAAQAEADRMTEQFRQAAEAARVLAESMHETGPRPHIMGGR